jgi:histidine ammonia-lyase
VTLVDAPGVTIGTADLDLDDLVAIAHGAPVALDDDAWATIDASRAIVDAVVDGPDLVYGLNTGVGHQRDVALQRDSLRRIQALVVRVHEGGVGDALPTVVVRGAMAARLNGIARGGSGASRPVAQGLVALLNARVHPVVPQTGSVGASDLMHMAAIGQVLIGHGHAEVDGDVLPGAAALARAGLAPLELEPKDGLSIISANGVAIGHAALLVERAERLAEAADLVLAASLEATRGNPSMLDDAVLSAKPVPGQLAAGRSVRRFLAGSRLFEPGGPQSVQDPLSFRVGPQVHGAFREFAALLRSAAQLELNARDDNPLVDVAAGRMLSNGNFHPMVLALALDALRPAAAHVGILSDRRMDHLWSAVADVFSSEEMMVRLIDGGGGLTRYAAAALVSQLRHAANPVTLDVPSLDMGVEDHSTNAPVAADLTARALDLLEGILAAELQLARLAAGVQVAGGGVAPAVGAAFEAVEAVTSQLASAPSSAAVHGAIAGALCGDIVVRARAAIPSA